jgi:hypothetical protein
MSAGFHSFIWESDKVVDCSSMFNVGFSTLFVCPWILTELVIGLQLLLNFDQSTGARWYYSDSIINVMVALTQLGMTHSSNALLFCFFFPPHPPSLLHHVTDPTTCSGQLLHHSFYLHLRYLHSC